MKMNLSGAELFLPAGGLLRLEDACGRRISCTAGILWITVTGEREDVFLRANECYEIPAQGLALVEAIEDSRFAFGIQMQQSAASCAWLSQLFRVRAVRAA